MRLLNKHEKILVKQVIRYIRQEEEVEEGFCTAHGYSSLQWDAIGLQLFEKLEEIDWS